MKALTYTEAKEIYMFDELNKEAQRVAIKDIEEDNYYLGDDWFQYEDEDFKNILELIGFYDIETSFSGFHYQGAGARFTGSYYNKKRISTKMKAYAPLDVELNRISRDIMKIQQRNNYEVEATIGSTSSNYYHSNTMSVEVYNSSNEDIVIREDEEFEDLCKDLAIWYYDSLRGTHDYLMSDEAIIEHLRSSEREFYMNGTSV